MVKLLIFHLWLFLRLTKVLKMCKRNIKPHFNVHETKKFGPFKVNIHSYGEKNTILTMYSID